MKSEVRNPKPEVSEAETQKLRKELPGWNLWAAARQALRASAFFASLRFSPVQLNRRGAKNAETRGVVVSGLSTAIARDISGVGEAETQKLRKRIGEFGTQELRKADKVAEQSAPFRRFLPEFLSSKFLSSLSEFLSFGFAPFGLRSSGFGFKIFLLSLSCFLTAPTVFAQSNSVINVGPGGRLIIATPGGGQMVITGQNVIRFSGGQPVLDPQIAAAMQMSANEPGFAQAEFDPPVITVGGSSTYRW